jgi:coiled-coil and C2 domain-containing protein 2A
LFDRQQYQHLQEGNLITQEEHRFIGSMQVPLKTVLQNPGKMEFNFKLNRPLVLPSYNVVPSEVYFMSSEADIDDQKLRENEQIPTYINLSISLDPPLELPSDNDQSFYMGYESSLLLTMGSNWQAENSKQFKDSKLKVFGENIKGQSVLLCRYLTPIKPPKEVVDLERFKNDPYAIERAARFVSMVPFVDDLTMFKNLPDMYSTSQEFLDLGAGDYEEHAILLANYFQYIDDQ